MIQKQLLLLGHINSDLRTAIIKGEESGAPVPFHMRTFIASKLKSPPPKAGFPPSRERRVWVGGCAKSDVLTKYKLRKILGPNIVIPNVKRSAAE